jgi:25S rRNA (uracil2634-N3)-methyltransferase
MPQSQASRERKHPPDDDDDGGTDDEDNEMGGVGGRTRGTILITLRNVPPYSEWFAYRCCSQWLLADIIFA